MLYRGIGRRRKQLIANLRNEERNCRRRMTGPVLQSARVLRHNPVTATHSKDRPCRIH
jgi:hypothetical protein